MLSYLLPRANLTLADFDEPRVFDQTADLAEILDLKTNLNKTKSELDQIYKLRNATKIMVEFNPFAKEKYNIADSINASNITVAWLKGYELMYAFHLIPRRLDSTSLTKFVHFDNAAFPGSFILAAQHLAITCNTIKYNWVASSLLNNYNPIIKHTPLADTFKLYHNYPTNWLMHKYNNGDIGCTDNIHNFQTQIVKKFRETANIELTPKERYIDFYSCDLGIGIAESDKYNDQEKIHFHLNICQLICGLLTLKPNGDMLVKHYTIFEHYTISYLSLLTMLFKEVYIVKPLTSKRTNSEIYIVCKEYLFPFNENSVEARIYDIFLGQSDNTKDYTPIISSKKITNQIHAIKQISYKIFGRQIDSLKNYIYLAKNYNNITIRKNCYAKLNIVNTRIRDEFGKIRIPRISNICKLITCKDSN